MGFVYAYAYCSAILPVLNHDHHLFDSSLVQEAKVVLQASLPSAPY